MHADLPQAEQGAQHSGKLVLRERRRRACAVQRIVDRALAPVVPASRSAHGRRYAGVGGGQIAMLVPEPPTRRRVGRDDARAAVVGCLDGAEVEHDDLGHLWRQVQVRLHIHLGVAPHQPLHCATQHLDAVVGRSPARHDGAPRVPERQRVRLQELELWQQVATTTCVCQPLSRSTAAALAGVHSWAPTHQPEQVLVAAQHGGARDAPTVDLQRMVHSVRPRQACGPMNTPPRP